MNQSSISFNNLHPYQKEAIETTINLLTSGKKKVLLELATGTGKTIVITELIKYFFNKGIAHNALILTDTRISLEHFTHIFNKELPYTITHTLAVMNENHITVLTYSKFRSVATIDAVQGFDLIICNEAQYINNEKISHIFKNIDSMFVGLISSHYTLGFISGEPVFSYSLKDSIDDGYAYLLPMRSPEYGQAAENFCNKLLSLYGCQIVSQPKFNINNMTIRPDMKLICDNQQIIIEIKAYRGRYVPKDIIDTAITQILEYKNTIQNSELTSEELPIVFCLVLFCEIDAQQKEQLFKQHNIIMWDISNLLYLCTDNPDLLRELSELVYFPTSDIVPQRPNGWIPQKLSFKQKITKNSIQTYAESLEEELIACKVGKGKKFAAEYEQICTKIVSFLFDGEFTQCSNQHKTDDDLFRMDLLCGIKGSSAFWGLLIRHYNTRFVVFEYKNYSSPLPQNLIYTTEKYLFNAALRNVAIIISRKGFSKNAHITALGCLKESGKLIIDLTDADLTEMLHKKADGEDASDYLLFKLEHLLMSVSK